MSETKAAPDVEVEAKLDLEAPNDCATLIPKLSYSFLPFPSLVPVAGTATILLPSAGVNSPGDAETKGTRPLEEGMPRSGTDSGSLRKGVCDVGVILVTCLQKEAMAR